MDPFGAHSQAITSGRRHRPRPESMRDREDKDIPRCPTTTAYSILGSSLAANKRAAVSQTRQQESHRKRMPRESTKFSQNCVTYQGCGRRSLIIRVHNLSFWTTLPWFEVQSLQTHGHFDALCDAGFSEIMYLQKPTFTRQANGKDFSMLCTNIQVPLQNRNIAFSVNLRGGRHER